LQLVRRRVGQDACVLNKELLRQREEMLFMTASDLIDAEEFDTSCFPVSRKTCASRRPSTSRCPSATFRE